MSSVVPILSSSFWLNFPASRLIRARPQMVCENADEHPALAPEHCTLVSHVKAGDAKRIDFSMLLAEDKRKPHCGSNISPLRGTRCAHLGGKSGEVFGLTNAEAGRVPLRSHVDRDINRRY